MDIASSRRCVVARHDGVVITADEVMPLLLSACPSFVPKWEAVAGENVDEDDPSKRLCYLDAGDFIRHLVELRLAGRIEEMPAVFEVIERLHVEGDHYVRELATIGYLEGLQMRTVTEAGLRTRLEQVVGAPKPLVGRRRLRPPGGRFWRLTERP